MTGSLWSATTSFVVIVRMVSGSEAAPEPVGEIIARALAESDDDVRWEHVMALHLRSDRASLEVLLALLGDAQADRRELAADALGQFATDRERPADLASPFAYEIVDALIAAAASERNAAVMGSIAVAFGHLADERAVTTLAGWRNHEADDVRLDVAFGLGGFDTDLAVDALMTLMTDRVDGVRDWATFGLGVQTERDGPEIRNALYARLEDTDAQTRAEALHSLALRGDASCISVLLREHAQLDPADGWDTLTDAVVELAARIPDPRLCAIVRQERDRWQSESPEREMYGTLQTAIAACSAGT